MCGSKGGGSSNAAEDQRRLDAERQTKIAAEQERVNQAFAAYDDPNYFSGVTKAYTDHYAPQLTKQYNNAREQLIYARPGGGDSSAYNAALANLEEERMRQESSISDQAGSFANDYRGNIEGERTSLLSLASANAGNGVAAQQSVAKAGAMAKPPAYSALGDVFAGFTGQLSNAAAARNAGYNVPGVIPDIRVGSVGSASRTVK